MIAFLPIDVSQFKIGVQPWPKNVVEGDRANVGRSRTFVVRENGAEIPICDGWWVIRPGRDGKVFEIVEPEELPNVIIRRPEPDWAALFKIATTGGADALAKHVATKITRV